MSSVPLSRSTLDQLRRQLIGSQAQPPDRSIISTGFSSVDSLLPQQGIPTGSLVDWVSDTSGIRATSFALNCAGRFLHKPGAMVVIDPHSDFNPTSICSAGIPHTRLLLIRPQPGNPSRAESQTLRMNALWSLEQLARCAGVRVVMTWVKHLSATAQRRLQLAVEQSGVTVFLMRPPQALKHNSWADLRFHVKSLSLTKSTGRELCHEPKVISVQLIRSKNAVQHQGTAYLEWHYETGIVSETSELACTAISEAQSL